MSIRTILAAVSGGGASRGVIDAALRLGQRLGAHVEALHVRADPTTIMVGTADSFTPPSLTEELIDRFEHETATVAAAARAMFDEAMASRQIPTRALPPPVAPGAPPPAGAVSGCWREITGDGAVEVAARARLFDLLVFGRSHRVADEPGTDAIETALLAGGRPLYIAPAQPSPTIAESVAVAWNETAEAAKALSAALPLMEGAREVHLLSVGESRAGEMAAHLAWHGISARAVTVEPVPGAGTGELLLSAARDAGADLLVMGGYGHAPWRESLFGGVTADVLGASLLPLLLSH